MIADNNILNIRTLPGKREWVGQTGERKGFCCFVNVEYCIRAWLRLMHTYRQKHGLKTVRDIIHRYAPPSENDTRSYVRYCCKQLGVKPTEELKEALQYAALCVAMAKMETGINITEMSVEEVMAKYGLYGTEEYK